MCEAFLEIAPARWRGDGPARRRGRIGRCRPLIFVEHEKTDFAAVKAFLRDANYRSYYAQRPNILCPPGEITHIRIEHARTVEY